MYYLNSRFYDPGIGRFINADNIDLVLASQTTLTDKNLYAYCDNNPVMRTDEDGEFWHIAAGAVVGAFSQYISNVVGRLLEGNSLGSAMKITEEDVPGLLGSAPSGALLATGISAGGLAIANAAINTTTYLAECEITGTEVNKAQLAINVGVGIISDATGGGGIDGKRLRGVWNTANQKLSSSTSVRKIAQYTAKKVAVKKTVRNTIGSTFVSTIWSNNHQKFFRCSNRKGNK